MNLPLNHEDFHRADFVEEQLMKEHVGRRLRTRDVVRLGGAHQPRLVPGPINVAKEQSRRDNVQRRFRENQDLMEATLAEQLGDTHNKSLPRGITHVFRGWVRRDYDAWTLPNWSRDGRLDGADA